MRQTAFRDDPRAQRLLLVAVGGDRRLRLGPHGRRRTGAVGAADGAVRLSGARLDRREPGAPDRRGRFGNARQPAIRVDRFRRRRRRDAASSLPASWWACAWRMPWTPAFCARSVAVLCLVVGICARRPRAGRAALTSRLRILARGPQRGAGRVCPGNRHAAQFRRPAPRAPRHAPRGRLVRFLVHELHRYRRPERARVRQRVADAPPRRAAAGPHRLYAAAARDRQRAERRHGLAPRQAIASGCSPGAAPIAATSRNSARDSTSRSRDRGPAQAVIAVQGDISRRTIERCFPGIELAALPYFGFQRAMFGDTECWIARLGYSGETGYELVIADAAAASLWQALLEAGSGRGPRRMRIRRRRLAADRGRPHPVHARARLADDAVRARVRAIRRSRSARVLRCAGPAAHRAGRSRSAASWASCRRRMPRPSSACPGASTTGSAVMTSACWSPLLERRIGMGFVAALRCRAGHRGSTCATARAPGLPDCRITIPPRCCRAALPRRTCARCTGGGRAAMKRTPLYDQHVRDASTVINLKGFARAMQYVGHVRRASGDAREREPVRRVAHGRARVQGAGRAGARAEDHHQRRRQARRQPGAVFGDVRRARHSSRRPRLLPARRPIISSGSSTSPRPTTTISGC